MRQPTREEYEQLKSKGYEIIPIHKAIENYVMRKNLLDRDDWKEKYVMSNNTVIQSPNEYEGTCSIGYLYKKGVLV